MSTTADRLDLRLSADDKSRIRRAADLHGVPLAAFVREAMTIAVTWSMRRRS